MNINTAKLIPIVLAGGKGSRLWPLSRSAYPKQLMALLGDHTLLQSTLKRLQHSFIAQSPIIVANHEHRFIVAEQLREQGIQATILLEPCMRNTTLAVAVAALYALQTSENPVLFVTPVDHSIPEESLDTFWQFIAEAYHQALAGQLVTFGITPTRIEPAYGYIKGGDYFIKDKVRRVTQFVEKPKAEMIKHDLMGHDHYWNSGMFMFQATQIIDELEQYAPDILRHARQAIATCRKDLDFFCLDSAAYRDCPCISFDYAIMEKTQNAVLIPFDIAWHDVGSWQLLWQIENHDEEGNVVRGEVVRDQTRNCYLRAEDRLLATFGVSDLVVVETADAVLVADRKRCQDMKLLTNQLNDKKRKELDTHLKVHRPWGYYDVLNLCDAYRVKRIVVKAKARLSLQMHRHRAEHWVILKGTARITREQETFLLHANQSTYIPAGVKHRLDNPTDEALELIEVQVGSYIGEDDIIRFTDDYGRDVSRIDNPEFSSLDEA